VVKLMHDEINHWILKSKLQSHEPFVVINGGCPTGADKIAANMCAKWNIAVEVYPADWSKGLGAGPARNRKMAEACDRAILFFKHGEPNKGTTNMKRELDRLGKPNITYWV
jgi:hypothetical protein